MPEPNIPKWLADLMKFAARTWGVPPEKRKQASANRAAWMREFGLGGSGIGTGEYKGGGLGGLGATRPWQAPNWLQEYSQGLNPRLGMPAWYNIVPAEYQANVYDWAMENQGKATNRLEPGQYYTPREMLQQGYYPYTGTKIPAGSPWAGGLPVQRFRSTPAGISPHKASKTPEGRQALYNWLSSLPREEWLKKRREEGTIVGRPLSTENTTATAGDVPGWVRSMTLWRGI